MTAISHHAGHAAGSRYQPPHLAIHQFRADLRCFLRNKASVFWTLALPVLFLVIFGSAPDTARAAPYRREKWRWYRP